MKTYKITITFMDNDVKRTAIIDIKANSNSEATNKIMDVLKKRGATNITIVTSQEVK